jgi:RHS repeat-associated protein
VRSATFVAITGGSNLPFRFGGKWGYYMPGVPTWILYIQQRWLDVALAQWTSRDLIGYKGGWNKYEFVDNNSVQKLDPSGLGSWNLCYCFFACAFTLEYYSECIEACDAATIISEAGEVIKEIGRRRKRCESPKTSSDCLECPGKGAYFKDQCGECCNKLPSEDLEACTTACGV